MVDLEIVTIGPSWHWLTNEQPSEKMAITLLNYLLEKGKKQKFTAIPGLDTATDKITTLLQEISEKLTHYTPKEKGGLKTNENSQIELSLFSIDETRLKIACAIASGVYADKMAIEATEVNSYILKATDDLINQLLKTK